MRELRGIVTDSAEGGHELRYQFLNVRLLTKTYESSTAEQSSKSPKIWSTALNSNEKDAEFLC